MLCLKLYSHLDEYSKKIVAEDLIMLNVRKDNLDDDNWAVYFEKYCESFNKKNAFLFELLMRDIISGNQLTIEEIRNISSQFAFNTLKRVKICF